MRWFVSDDDERTTINKRLIKHSPSSSSRSAFRSGRKPHSAHLSEFTSSVKLIGTQTNSLLSTERFIYISYASTSSSVEHESYSYRHGTKGSCSTTRTENSSRHLLMFCLFVRSVALSKIDSSKMMRVLLASQGAMPIFSVTFVL